MNNIIGILRGLGGAQPVIAEWLNAETPLDLWPDVPRLRSFPISRYYRAFDFTISGAGYNSFNEIISFGVPSVLVPNPGTRMDNQSARAAYADDNRAAIHLDAELSPMLREVLTMIQDRKFRRAMVQNCRQLARPNGADGAANVIEEVTSFSGSAK